jgi:hypothetical protein
MDGLNWRKASYSAGNGGGCVEVGNQTRRVLVRDTRDRTGPVLGFSSGAWRRFAEQVKRSLAAGLCPGPDGRALAGERSGVAGALPFRVWVRFLAGPYPGRGRVSARWLRVSSHEGLPPRRLLRGPRNRAVESALIQSVLSLSSYERQRSNYCKVGKRDLPPRPGRRAISRISRFIGVLSIIGGRTSCSV